MRFMSLYTCGPYMGLVQHAVYVCTCGPYIGLVQHAVYVCTCGPYMGLVQYAVRYSKAELLYARK